MAVVVKKARGRQRYYVSRIVAPDGSVFTFNENEDRKVTSGPKTGFVEPTNSTELLSQKASSEGSAVSTTGATATN